MVVYKSDKTYEEYSQDKIRKGICEAYNSAGEECQDELIDSIISNLFVYEKISSKEIRRQVEESLMSINKKVARAYIEKFKEIDEDNKALKDKDDFIQSYIKASNASTGSKYDSNANVSNKNIATLNAEIPKRNNIKFNRYNTSNKIANLYSKKLAKQYVNDLESHIIYKHDESTFGINSPYTYSAKETVEVKYKDRHLMLPFDLLWEVLTENEVLVNEIDGVWQKYPKDLYVKDRGNVFTHVSVMTRKIRKRDLVRVKTSFGEDVVVTDNHPMIVSENDVNDTVEAQYAKGCDQFKIGEKIKFDGNVSIDMSLCHDTTAVDKTVDADEVLGYLVGSLIGDDTLEFNDANKSISISQKNSTYTFKTQATWWLLKEVFKVQEKIEDRILPYNLLEYNEDFAKGILGGIIDSRGMVNGATFEIRTPSRALVIQLNSLLRHFNYDIDDAMEDYGTWVVKCSRRNDSLDIKMSSKLSEVMISDEPSGYNKDGKTVISSVVKIGDDNTLLNLNEFIYDITTDSRTFALNNILVHNCVAIQSYPFLINGLKTLGGLSAAPKNLDSFCGMFINLIFAVSSQFAGACLYKDQELLISDNGEIRRVKARDLVNSFDLDKSFSNYQGEWEYKDVSDRDIMVAEDNRLVKVNKVFRRKYDKDIYHIKSHGSFECFVSEDHRFKSLINDREIELKAKDLTLNDTVFINDDYNYIGEKSPYGLMSDLSAKGSRIDTIKAIETFKNDDEYVYEIETETHWYNCGGFITHNCAVSGALLMFEYYCRKEWGDDYYLHDDRTAKIKYGKDGDEEKITISKQIDQYFQQIVYSINQPAAARGFQSAFVNFAYFDKPYFDGMYGEFKFPDGTKPSWESLSYIQKKFMKWFNKERTKCVLTFPVETMSLLYKDGEFVDKEYADFTAEMYAEGHSFFTYISDSPDTLSSCCFSKDQKVLVNIDDEPICLTFGELYEKVGNKEIKIFHKDGWKNGKTISLPKRKMYKVITENNKELVVSDNHINITYDGEKQTCNLTTNDFLLTNINVNAPKNFFVLNVLKNLKLETYDKVESFEIFMTNMRIGSMIEKNDGLYSIKSCDPNENEFFKIKDGVAYVKIKSINEVNYDDDIYCFEMTNKDEPYFTLPNGIITHNCRLSNKINENTFSFTNGLTGESTGSKSVITLNYNRIIQNFVNETYNGNRNIWKENKEDFKEKFKAYLTAILERVYKYHTAYNEILWDLYEANMLPVYSAGFIHLNKQYLTIGLNGVNEGWMFLGGECRYSEDYVEFCKLICGTMKEQNSLHRTKKTMFNSEFVPAESLGIKNYKWDMQDGYWVPEGRNCYTSYFFLPDDEDVTVLEKMKLHGKEFVENLDGGSACHINLKEHLSKEQYKALMNYAGENGTNYFTFNVKNSECADCGYISKHTIDVCPHCGSKNIDYYTRIIGYLVKVKSFNEGRKAEESKRVYS